MLPQSSSSPIPTEPIEARIDHSDPILKILQKRIYSNYTSVAYFFVLGTYFCAFGLYIYLRLASFIFPEKFVYRRACDLLRNETIVRNWIHYGSITLPFLAVTFIQISAFFLLTVSSTYINFERRYHNFISMEEKLLLELRYKIRKIMYELILPTFLVYFLTSLVVLASIFYMVGLRDEIVDTTSQVIVYFFDACVFSYFLFFPLISFMFHPDIQCSFSSCYSIPSQSVPTSTAAAHLTAFRPISDDINNNNNSSTTPLSPEDLRIRTITSL